MAGHYMATSPVTPTPKEDSDLLNYTTVDHIMNIFAGRPGFEIPDPHAVVVHLQLGGVLESSNNTADTLWIHGSLANHPETKKRNATEIVYSTNEYLDFFKEATIGTDDIIGTILTMCCQM